MYSGIAGVNGVMDEESYDGIAHSMDGWVMYPDTKKGRREGGMGDPTNCNPRIVARFSLSKSRTECH